MKSRTRKKPTRMLFEELEPRILYSADAAAMLNPAILASGAEIRSLDADVLPAAPADNSGGTAAANTANGAPANTAAQADATSAAQVQRHEIVFVDTSVDGYQQLLADLSNDPARSIQVVLIDASRDGVAQISQALAGQHDIDAIHIVSHGADGELELGSTMLGFQELLTNATAIRGWGDALSSDADILLYGCDVAQSENGRAFVDALGRLTGTDVAASVDVTGTASHGGDWDLEYHDGLIESHLAFIATQLQSWDGTLAITQDAVSSAQNSSANSLTFSHTVGTGTDRLLIVQVALNHNSSSVSSVTYGGVALTKSGSAISGTMDAELWYLKAPASGTNNVVVATGGNPSITAGATSFFGVNQTTPLGIAVTTNSQNTPATPSATVASAAGELVIGVAAVRQGTTYSTGSGQTELWQRTVGSGGGATFGVTNTEAGAASVQMSWSINVGGGTGEWSEVAVAIKPAPNHAPAGTDKTITTLEDATYTFTSADFGFSDPNDLPADALANVKITTLPGAGSLALSGVAVTTGQFISAANIAAGNLAFTPSSNASGTGYVAFTFQVQDNGGTANGGVDLDQSANTITINVTAINDAPAGADKTVTALEDTDYVFAVADFGFADPNDSPANALSSVKITSLPGAGTLKLSGVAVTPGQFISAASIAAGNLKFTSAANANGAGYASFTFQVQDNGGTASGGVNLDPSANTITIDVTAVNDAPVNSLPTAQSVDEDDTLVFSSGNGNLISVSDLDAGASALQISLTGTNGTITLSGTTGLTFSTGDGTGDATMSFTGTAAAINAALDGMLFAPTPDFAGAASLQIVTNDQGNTGSGGAQSDTDIVAITVIADNDPPVITSNGGGATASISVAENTTAVTTVTATDPEAPTLETLVYSIIGGADAARFAINGTTGVLTFIAAPDYDVPEDANTDNVYDVTVQVSDSTFTDSQAISVTVTAANDNAPVITSNGGGATASVNVTENATAVTTVTATDADLPAQSLTYSIAGGADAAKFTINSTTGVLSFLSAPNYESPTDVNSDNIYNVTVQVSDGTLTDTQAVSVTVTAINDNAPDIASDGGGATASVNVAENITAITTVTATDADLPAQSLTYSIVGGADAAKFSINATTGALSFLAAPNYEAPTDADSNNVYQVTVQASDGSLTDTQTISVTVTAVNDNAPVITSSGGGATASVNVAENVTAVTTITATDADLPAQTLTYSIVGGADAAKFTINVATGALSFLVPPNYEAPTDADSDSVYDVTVQVSDGSLTDTQAIAVTVTAVNDDAPVIASDGGGATASVNVAESTTAVTTVTATDTDLPAQSLIYSIVGGADAAKFSINAASGALSFLVVPNYEAPTDADSNNVYQVTVQAFDGSLTDTQAISVTVTAVNDNAPVITSNGGGATASVNVAENTTAVTTITATDADLPAQTLTYAIAGGADAAKFTIDGSTGTLAFLAAPNTETPGDANADNIYYVTVQASDGTFTGTQSIGVHVTDVDEFDVGAVTDTNAAANQVSENASVGDAVGIIASAADADMTTNTITFSLDDNAGGRFAIGAASGVVTVSGALDYETDTSHTITVRATSADGSFNTQNFVIDVLDANEAGIGSISDIDGTANTVLENAANGTTVGITAFASDPDPTDMVTYSLDDDAGGRYAIDSNTGIVTVADSTLLNRESASSYHITVRATSDDTSSVTRDFTIDIGDVDEFNVGTVTDASGAANQVAENAANGTAIGLTAFAFDADATTSAISYSLDDDAGGRFAINGTTGVVTVANGSLLDREAAAFHTIMVRATSQDGSSSAQNFVIAVVGINDNAPVIVSGGGGATAAVNVAENATAVTTVIAADADLPAQSLTYTIVGGVDAAKFTIDTTSGALSFVSAPNFEVPADADLDNIYRVTVQASDGTLTDTQAIAVTVTAVDDNAPVITSDGGGANASVNVAENSAAVTTMTATDADLPAQSLSYSIVGGTDAAKFTINAATGALSFVTAPDFEGPTDSDLDNVYQVTVQVSDGTLTDTQAISVTVTAINDNAPIVTSDGGGTNASVNVAENATAVTSVTATDADLPTQSLTYSIVGGVDAGHFTIDAITGALSFVAAPNFESPTDTNLDNVYQVIVQVSDDTANDTQAIAITVTAVNENAPVITSNGGGASASVNVAENATAVATVAATDADLPAQSLTYTIVGGADAARFTIDALTGALSFAAAPNFEVPTDADLDNVYQVTVQVSDGSLIDTQAIAVTVTAVNDNAPVITSDGGGANASMSVAENTTVVTTLTTTDADLPGQSLTYSIVGGADAGSFAVDPVTGILSFVAAPNFEVPTDADLDNVYQVTVQVSDGGQTDIQTISVTVTTVNDNAPVITSDGGGPNASLNVAENATAVTTVTATDADLPAQSLTYSIVGGADAAKFAIDAVTGALSFVAAPNFEVPTDGNLDNVYQVTVQVSDGTLTDTQAIAVTVTAINDNAPIITSDSGGVTASINVAENTAAVTTVTATDADLPAQSLAYSIVGGADAAEFMIDAVTGALSFATAPNFEAPADTNLDNVYQVIVQVSDGTANDTQAITITVTAANDNAPLITSNGGGASASVNVAENATAVATVAATDADLPAQSLTYTIVGGADATRFTIDAVTGALSFAAAPNFEVLTDADLDNVYQVTVQVSDGSLIDTQAIAVTVTAVNDNAPVITSDGGGANASMSVAENTTVVTTLTTTDADLPGQSLTYSIVGGADAGSFAIDPVTGILSFVAAPNFEVPTDADLDNVYQLTVRVTDGTLTDTQAISVTVTAINEAPIITSDGGGANASVNVAENAASVTTVAATDSDLPTPALTYSITGGADAAKFTIDAVTGALTFIAAPDYDVPGDANADNVYDVTVQTSDGSLTDTQAIAVTVTALNDSPPIITSNGAGATASVNVTENTTGVTTVSATDADLPVQSHSYSIVGGADAAKFTINAVTGALRFIAAPDFEVPVDADLDNVYQVTVRVSDGTLTDTQAIAVTVIGTDEAPILNSAALALNEGQTVSLSGGNLGITDVDSASFVYTVSGVSGGYFQLTSAPGVAVTTFSTADLAGNRVQFVDNDDETAPSFSVTVNDGTTSSNTLAAAITYNPVNDAPVVTGATLAVTEGRAAMISGSSIVVTDPDSASFTYIVSGVSGGYFQLTSAPGTAVTSFTSTEIAGNLVQFVHDGSQAAPAFNVSVNDGTASSNTVAASITYTTVNDAPTGAPTVTGQATSGQTLSGSTASIADPDGLGALALQWERSNDGGASWTGIAGSTTSTYILGASDVGSIVRLNVSYTDGRGTVEHLTSAATAPIMGGGSSSKPAPAPQAPAPAPEVRAAQDAPHAAPGADGRSAPTGGGLRAGAQFTRAGADTTEATAQSLAVRTTAVMAQAGAAAAAAASEAPDGTRYSKAMPVRTGDLVAPALIKIEMSAQATMPPLIDPLGFSNGTRFEPASVTSMAGEGGSDEGVQERAAIVTAETGVKLSGAVVSAGFVVWALRGVGLLTSLLSSIPAWRHLDPVPVLAPEEDKPDWDDNDDQESAREERAVSNLFSSADATGADRRTT